MFSGIEVFIAKARYLFEGPTLQIAPRPNKLGKLGGILAFLLVCSQHYITAQQRPLENKAQEMTASSIRDLDSPKDSIPFYQALTKALKKRKWNINYICPPGDRVARRILEEYGAVYIATKKVLPPPLCVFTNESEVSKFQDDAGVASEVFGYDEIELQPEALKALKKAREEAQKEGLDITPRDGAEAARRNYDDSVRLWNSRFQPALDYWLDQGRLTVSQVNHLRSLSLADQIAEVLELEKDGIYFSKDLSKSILYSIAAPGTSQHIAMLAFDVNEFENLRVREIMAKHGWFQTVISDLPHFTYLGLKEKDLPKNGLRCVQVNGQVFWIPNVAGTSHPGLDNTNK